jgi:hypothetical protein
MLRVTVVNYTRFFVLEIKNALFSALRIHFKVIVHVHWRQNGIRQLQLEVIVNWAAVQILRVEFDVGLGAGTRRLYGRHFVHGRHPGVQLGELGGREELDGGDLFGKWEALEERPEVKVNHGWRIASKVLPLQSIFKGLENFLYGLHGGALLFLSLQS